MTFDPKINPKSLRFAPFIIPPGSNVNTLPNELNDLLQTLSDKLPNYKIDHPLYHEDKIAFIERRKITNSVEVNEREYLLVTFPKSHLEVVSEKQFRLWFIEKFPGFDPPDSVPNYQQNIEFDFRLLQESNMSAAVVDEEIQATQRAQEETREYKAIALAETARATMLEAKLLLLKDSGAGGGISTLSQDGLVGRARISMGQSDDEVPVELDNLIEKLPDKLRARDDVDSPTTYEVKLIKFIGNIGLVEVVPTVSGFKDEDESKYLAVSCRGSQDSNKFETWFSETFVAGIPKIVSYDTPDIEMRFQKLQPILEDICGQLAGRMVVLDRTIENLRKQGASDTAGQQALIQALETELKKATRAREEIIEIKPRLEPLKAFLDVLPRIANIAKAISGLYDNYVNSQLGCEGLNKYDLFGSTCTKEERDRFRFARCDLQIKVAELYNLVQRELIEKKEELILNLILKKEIFGIDVDQELIDINKSTENPEERQDLRNQLKRDIEAKQIYYCGFSSDLKNALRKIINTAEQMLEVSNGLDIEGAVSLETEFNLFHRDAPRGVNLILNMINDPLFMDGFMMSRGKARARIQELQEQIKFLKQEGLI